MQKCPHHKNITKVEVMNAKSIEYFREEEKFEYSHEFV